MVPCATLGVPYGWKYWRGIIFGVWQNEACVANFNHFIVQKSRRWRGLSPTLNQPTFAYSLLSPNIIATNISGHTVLCSLVNLLQHNKVAITTYACSQSYTPILHVLRTLHTGHYTIIMFSPNQHQPRCT